jgi:pilus assembly protein CpaD
MTTASIRDRSRRSALLASIAVGCLAITLAACTSSGGADPIETATTISTDDYRINHPITIDEKIEALDVPVSVDTVHLTEASRANIAFFAQAFLRSQTAIIAVVAPSGSPNQVAAASVAVEVEDALRRNGVNPRSISYRVYKAGADEKIAPVRVAFNHIAASTAPCGPWMDDITKSDANRHYGSFGCATQQNLAAVIDNPLDLLYPRGMSPADAARRADVLEKYRNGSRFTGDTSGESGGSIASVGGN